MSDFKSQVIKILEQQLRDINATVEQLIELGYEPIIEHWVEYDCCSGKHNEKIRVRGVKKDV